MYKALKCILTSFELKWNWKPQSIMQAPIQAQEQFYRILQR